MLNFTEQIDPQPRNTSMWNQQSFSKWTYSSVASALTFEINKETHILKREKMW